MPEEGVSFGLRLERSESKPWDYIFEEQSRQREQPVQRP